MPTPNPNSLALEIRHADAWLNDLRTKAWVKLNQMFLDEDLKGKSARVCQVVPFTLAIDYMGLVHSHLEAPYAQPTTSADVKDDYGYSDVRDCFMCNNIYLEDLWDTTYDIPTLATTNDDVIDDPDDP